MKQIFTLFALASLCLFENNAQAQQVNENFNATALPSTCWTTTGFSSRPGNGGKVASTKGSINATLSTPYITVPQNSTVSFFYQASKNVAGMTFNVYAISKSGSTFLGSGTGSTTAQTFSAPITTTTEDTVRISIVYTSIAGDHNNTYIDFDNLTISGSYRYTNFCNAAVSAVNDSYNPPTITTIVSGNVLSNDTDANTTAPENETLSVVLPITQPAEGTVDMDANGNFTFTPNSTFTGGIVTFTYTVTDNGFAATTSTATVTMNYPVSGSLPIKLVSFNGALNNGKAQLTWTADENETGNYFEVQKSTDGKNFTVSTVYFVTNKSGRENYQHSEELASATYYRLKVVNKDNSVSYSKVVFLKEASSNNDATKINLLQNPIQSNTLRFNFTSESAEAATVTLYNMSGVAVYSAPVKAQKGVNVINLNVTTDLTSGNYIMEVRSNTIRKTVKVTK